MKKNRAMIAFVIILLFVTNWGTYGIAKSRCPEQQIHLSCPDECPEIPPCPDCDPVLEPLHIVPGEGVRCTVEGGVVYCDKVEACETVEPEVEIERRHKLSLGGGWDSGTTSSGAVAGMLLWQPKLMDQRHPLVPTTLAFTVTHDLTQFDPDPMVTYEDLAYQSGIQEGADGFPIAERDGYCYNCPPYQLPTPIVSVREPDRTRYGVSLLWTLKK